MTRQSELDVALDGRQSMLVRRRLPVVDMICSGYGYPHADSSNAQL